METPPERKGHCDQMSERSIMGASDCNGGGAGASVWPQKSKVLRMFLILLNESNKKFHRFNAYVF